MNTKITLYSDKELIEKIKKYAKEKNTSVSTIVNEFFKSLLEKNESSPVTNSLAGILKNKKLDKKDYYKHLEEKYL
jgi:tartrate dehydratase alpha subunit/fumarate hydratase class I-like protein